MNTKRPLEVSSRNESVEFKLDRISEAVREKLSGKELKKEVEKDLRLIGQHRLDQWLKF